MTDKERIDKRFLKLCKWMSEAREIAKILREECAHIERMDRQGWKKDADEYCKGIRSALFMLEFLPELMENPANYREEPEKQKDIFPGLAFGLMFLGVAVGEMKLRNCWGDCCARMPYDRWRAWLAEEADGADCSDRADGSKTEEEDGK
jgi:hypothetical protein